jgi:hypothetical protein
MNSQAKPPCLLLLDSENHYVPETTSRGRHSKYITGKSIIRRTRQLFVHAHDRIELLPVIQWFIRIQIVLRPPRFNELLGHAENSSLTPLSSAAEKAQNHQSTASHRIELHMLE